MELNKMQAVILAGGRGERMDILCRVRPKPAMPFAGRFKVIDFTLSNCIYSGISDIAVMTDYQRVQMGNYLRQWQLANAGSIDFHVLEPGTSYTGTADAIYQNLGYLDKHNIDKVLILGADHVYKLDYRKMLAFHEESNADMTIGVVQVPIEEAHRFGTAIVDADGRIVDYVEKPSIPRSNLVSMGIHLFNRNTLVERLIEDANNPESRHDLAHSIVPLMVKRDRVFAYRFHDYWQDVGTIEAYYETNMELTREQPGFSVDGKSPVLTEERHMAPPYIGDEATVINSVVSPGCVIRGRVENSILSPGVCVEEQAEVRDSVVMENTFVGYHSIVDRCVLDEDVNIGEYCYVGFGPLSLSCPDITVLGKGAVVPSHTAIGRKCKISPNASPADFTTGVVSSGTIISNARKGDMVGASV